MAGTAANFSFKNPLCQNFLENQRGEKFRGGCYSRPLMSELIRGRTGQAKHAAFFKRSPIMRPRSSKEDARPSVSGVVEQEAKLFSSRSEKLVLEELEKPLSEYMSLPVSQYSVLDAQRIERIDENIFKCYAHKIKFFAFEVCPVLTVSVEETKSGCCIRLLSCKLEGSKIIEAQNEKFSAKMENNVSWEPVDDLPLSNEKTLISQTELEVTLQVPQAFSFLSVELIESTGNKVLSQVLKIMVPRFLEQLAKDYRAWATGDVSRKPLGTGEM